MATPSLEKKKNAGDLSVKMLLLQNNHKKKEEEDKEEQEDDDDDAAEQASDEVPKHSANGIYSQTRIRVGKEFQASVPDLRNLKKQEQLQIETNHQKEQPVCVFDVSKMNENKQEIDQFLELMTDIADGYVHEDVVSTYEMEAHCLQHLHRYDYDVKLARATILANYCGYEGNTLNDVFEWDGPTPKCQRTSGMSSWDKWLTESKKIFKQKTTRQEIEWFLGEYEKMFRRSPFELETNNDPLYKKVQAQEEFLQDKLLDTKNWIIAVHRIFCLPVITNDTLDEIKSLLAVPPYIHVDEFYPLEKLYNAISQWLSRVSTFVHVDAGNDTCSKRAEKSFFMLQQLFCDAKRLGIALEPMQSKLEGKLETVRMIRGQISQINRSFGGSNSSISSCSSSSIGSNQSSSKKIRVSGKISIAKLRKLLQNLHEVDIFIPEEESLHELLQTAITLEKQITVILGNRSSMSEIRNLISKCEALPIDLSESCNALREKMSMAKKWIEKARKCMPLLQYKKSNKKQTRSVQKKTSNYHKNGKMDLSKIKDFLTESCDSVERDQMFDLVGCAEDWIERVDAALKQNQDLTLLKKLCEEGNEMPIAIEQQAYLEEEIRAQDWSKTCAMYLDEPETLEVFEEHLELLVGDIRKDKTKAYKLIPHELELKVAIQQANDWLRRLASLFDLKQKCYLEISQCQEISSLPSDSKNSNNAKPSLEQLKKIRAESMPVNMENVYKALDKLIKAGNDCETEIRDFLGSFDDKEKPEMGEAVVLVEKYEKIGVVFENGKVLGERLRAARVWLDKIQSFSSSSFKPPLRNSPKHQQNLSKCHLNDLKEMLTEDLSFAFVEEKKWLEEQVARITKWTEQAREAIASFLSESLPIVQQLHCVDCNLYLKRKEIEEDIPMKASTRVINVQEILGKQLQNVATPKLEKEEEREVKVNIDQRSSVAEQTFYFQEVQVEPFLQYVRMAAGLTNKHHDDKKPLNQNLTIKCKKKSTGTGLSLLVYLNILEEIEQTITKLDFSSSTSYSDQKNAIEETTKVMEEESMLMNSLTGLVNRLNDSLVQSTTKQSITDVSFSSVETEERETLLYLIELSRWFSNSRRFLFSTDENDGGQEKLDFHDLLAEGNRLGMVTKNLNFFFLYPLAFLSKEKEKMMEWQHGISVFFNSKQQHQKLNDASNVAGDKLKKQKKKKKKKKKGMSLEEVCFFERKLESLVCSTSEIEEFIRRLNLEIRRAKTWCSKLRKAVLEACPMLQYRNNCIEFVAEDRKIEDEVMTLKRLSMVIVSNLVTEGKKMKIVLPVYQQMQTQLKKAQKWEQKVKDSGIESGQAKIVDLIELLQEYNQPDQYLVDLDQHKQVLESCAASAEERFCFCREAHDGFMIGCDSCEEWYHDSCIGLSKTQAEKFDSYTCPMCGLLKELENTLRTTNSAMKSLLQIQLNPPARQNLNDKAIVAAVRKLKREEKELQKWQSDFEKNNALITLTETTIQEQKNKNKKQKVNTSKLSTLYTSFQHHVPEKKSNPSSPQQNRNIFVSPISSSGGTVKNASKKKKINTGYFKNPYVVNSKPTPSTTPKSISVNASTNSKTNSTTTTSARFNLLSAGFPHSQSPSILGALPNLPFQPSLAVHHFARPPPHLPCLSPSPNFINKHHQVPILLSSENNKAKKATAATSLLKANLLKKQAVAAAVAASSGSSSPPSSSPVSIFTAANSANTLIVKKSNSGVSPGHPHSNVLLKKQKTCVSPLNNCIDNPNPPLSSPQMSNNSISRNLPATSTKFEPISTTTSSSVCQLLKKNNLGNVDKESCDDVNSGKKKRNIMEIPFAAVGNVLLVDLEKQLVERKGNVMELSKQLMVCQERVVRAKNVVEMLEKKNALKQEKIPLIKQWVAQVSQSINTHNILNLLMDEMKSKKTLYEVPCIASRMKSVEFFTKKSNSSEMWNLKNLKQKYQDSVCIPEAYMRLIELMSRTGVNGKDWLELETVVRCLYVVSWSLSMMVLMRGKAHYCQVEDCLSFARFYHLFNKEETKVLLPFKNMLTRLGSWQNKTVKLLAKTTGKPREVSRLKALHLESLKLPLKTQVAEELQCHIDNNLMGKCQLSSETLQTLLMLSNFNSNSKPHKKRKSNSEAIDSSEQKLKKQVVSFEQVNSTLVPIVVQNSETQQQPQPPIERMKLD